jgi:hypothetical protein
MSCAHCDKAYNERLRVFTDDPHNMHKYKFAISPCKHPRLYILPDGHADIFCRNRSNGANAIKDPSRSCPPDYHKEEDAPAIHSGIKRNFMEHLFMRLGEFVAAQPYQTMPLTVNEWRKFYNFNPFCCQNIEMALECNSTLHALQYFCPLVGNGLQVVTSEVVGSYKLVFQSSMDVDEEKSIATSSSSEVLNQVTDMKL